MDNVLLPPNLKALADLTSDNERWALGAVHLEHAADGPGYVATATNGRVAAIVEGTPRAGPDEVPNIPGSEAGDRIPHNAALIPAAAWKEGLALAPRNVWKAALECVQCGIYEDDVTFSATDLEKSRTLTARQLDGLFPDVRGVIPETAPYATVCLSAKHLISLLKVALQFAPGENASVTLEVRRSQDPVVLRTGLEHERFTGLVMPLAGPESTEDEANTGATTDG